MVESKEVIEYLLNHLDLKNCVSMFVAGSVPEVLEPQIDLDVFFVIDERKKAVFFDNLVEVTDKFVKKNSGVVYSFFRGPIKFERKGLIHFSVYTESNNYTAENKELFVNEHTTMLRSLLKTGKVLYGKSAKMLLKDVDLSNTDSINEHKERSREELRILKEKSYVDFPEWKKTSLGWKLVRTKIKADAFLRKDLIGYFEKSLNVRKNLLS